MGCGWVELVGLRGNVLRNKCLWLILLDSFNACNSVKRAEVFEEEVARWVPAYAHFMVKCHGWWVDNFYRVASGDTRYIRCMIGVYQGAPLGMGLFDKPLIRNWLSLHRLWQSWINIQSWFTFTYSTRAEVVVNLNSGES